MKKKSSENSTEAELELEGATKGFDGRCKDEIDELKMIFYQFFVNSNQENDNQKMVKEKEKGNHDASLDQGADTSKSVMYDQQQMEGIHHKLQELYDMKE